jgi:hypothetical protein
MLEINCYFLSIQLGDGMCRQTCPVKCGDYFTGVAFNITRGSKLLATA